MHKFAFDESDVRPCPSQALHTGYAPDNNYQNTLTHTNSFYLRKRGNVQTISLDLKPIGRGLPVRTADLTHL